MRQRRAGESFDVIVRGDMTREFCWILAVSRVWERAYNTGTVTLLSQVLGLDGYDLEDCEARADIL